MRASQLNKHEFVGWLALFFYTAETAGGYETSGSKLFYMDKDLKEITYSFDEDDFNNMADIEDINYEFEDDLKTVFWQDSPIMIGRLNIKK